MRNEVMENLVIRNKLNFISQAAECPLRVLCRGAAAFHFH